MLNPIKNVLTEIWSSLVRQKEEIVFRYDNVLFHPL